MKPNINDVSEIQDLKRALAEKNVSPTAITTLEKALKRGMSFKRVEDLTILDIPAIDVGTLSGAVVFGPATGAETNIKTVEYQFEPLGDETAFFGYQLVVRFVNSDGFTIEQAYPIEDENTVLVDYDLSVLRAGSRVTLRVNTATGSRAKLKLQGSASDTDDFVEIASTDLANAVIDVDVEPRNEVENPTVIATYPVKGKLISNKPDAKLDGYQVVLFAATNPAGAEPEFAPVAVARTETNGYFVTTPLLFENAADINHVTAAKAIVNHEDFKAELPIRLVTTPETTNSPSSSKIPDHVILVVHERLATALDAKVCECDLNFNEKKVLEEYSYYAVVRTSEPSIIADVLENEEEIDLQDIYGIPGVVPLSVFKKFHEIQSRQLNPVNFTAIAPTADGAPAPTGDGSLSRSIGTAITTSAGVITPKPPFNLDLLNKLMIDHKVDAVVQGDAKPIFRGRTHLNQMNQIDWDDTPTIYQAASIAHGHLLHFKQEWIADGYSLGDLVYSLPLAPGQKKQIAVLDWERRESAANTQALDYEESLNNALVRDRDVNEIVNGTLTENLRGNSRANTAGIGFGMGSSVMGIIPGLGTFGSLLGISGGASSSGSTANQNSNRDMTANSLQQISDRTQQAASVVRAQRATVVQTVSQGERVQATAESVANYNHCHAITIQYFEVLRHFMVRNRLAGVQECLFVPLQMTPFDIDKCLRWRNSLEKHLIKPELRGAFDAIARIKNEKESPFENYYDSIGFPRKNFAEQAINFYSGELFMEFFFFNTSAQKVDDAIVSFYSVMGISLDAYRDKQITDEDLAKQVGPRAIEYLLDAFNVETDKGVDLKLDLTLLSPFQQNAPLRISLRQSANTPRTIPRDGIDAITIKLDPDKLSPDVAQVQNKYMKIRLRSGNLRYRTDNFAGTLFDGSIDNDIFAGSDGAYMVTPLTQEELRNPRGEDVNAANNLIHHLNENLEFYHTALFSDFTPQRRLMLLDGIIAPGKANGRSVASVVENRVIGIAGNSLIMPVAPGYQLDPTIDETFDLFAQYYQDDPDPMRISIPTKGVYAEAVIGQCNSCEEKDETRFWRWEESPIPDSPTTQILPISTDTRRADPGDLQPKDFPNPMVNIQNAPSLPDPAGLQNLMQLLGKGDAFRDVTGLNQNQLNALATYQKTLDTAASFGKEAADLAKTAGMLEAIKSAKKEGTLTNEDARQKAEKVLDEGIKSQSNQKNAQFEQGMRLIDQMEKEGILSPQAAQNARQKVNSAFTDESDVLAKDESSLLKAFSPADDVTYTKKTNDGSELTISKSKPKSDLLEYIKANSTLADLQPPPSTPKWPNDLTLTAYGPGPMEWTNITWTPPHFALALREEYNERIDKAVFAGPTELISGVGALMGASQMAVEAAKQRTLQIIDMDMATEVATDSGRKDIAAAIETVTFSVISQCADILKSYIQSEASALPSGDVRFPVAVTYAAKQIGMILAWLEIASTKAVTAESDRVDYLKNTISFMTTSGSLGIPAEASFLSAAIDALVVSPLDADFASFQKAIRQLQRSYKRFSAKALEELLKRNYPSIVSVIGIKPNVENFAAHVLEGWADELEFLGE